MTDDITKLRMRVFAGPNGSGKSTVIRSVGEYRINNRPIDFGAYVNADDIARKLRHGKFSIEEFRLPDFDLERLVDYSALTGLFSYAIDATTLRNSIRFESGKVFLIDRTKDEAIAQIIANGLRIALKEHRRKFSFETVFSHPSKVDFIKQCAADGYKNYLYFVGTSSPDINKYRVKLRHSQGGHDVDPQKIVERYFRSMDLMWEAAQSCYQVYFFDNSIEGSQYTLFASYKMIDGLKQWDRLADERIPEWFKKYYLRKANAR